jgi:putative copper resistance protein D
LLAPGRRLWIIGGLLGAIATASFAWSGHGAATEGPGQAWHLLSDAVHGWAAALWVGALAGFSLLLRPRSHDLADATALYAALHRFGGLGSALVAVLIATGLVNSGFLVGLDHIEGLWTTPYGQLLSLKLVLFVAMLGLAAANRFALTPGLGRVLVDPTGRQTAVTALRRSLVIETGAGVAVLTLVAWFGTLAPPASL